MAKKKNKDNAPSKEDAANAINLIKEKQAENNSAESINKKRQKEEQEEKDRQEAEQRLIAEINLKVQKKLKENLLKKRKAEKKEMLIKELESGNKISWEAKNGGFILHGQFKDKNIFEIKRGLTLFSLYLTTEIIIKETVITENEKKIVLKKMEPSYLGCSTNLGKLKNKSEQLVELINLIL